jgi:hypothetical protein
VHAGVEVTGSPRVAGQPGRAAGVRRHLAALLIAAAYLLAAIAVTWNLWRDPSGQMPSTYTAHSLDVVLATWFMRYSAIAVAHGHLPALVTPALNWPRGINLMWNTSLVLPGIILAPVTLAFGPAVSLTVLMTAGFAGSAGTMCFVLRRWGASLGAATVAGAFYGFGPAVRMAAIDHYHLQFAVLPPLIIHLTLRLLTGRGSRGPAPEGRRGAYWRPVRTGALLGLLVAAQLYIAEEMLVLTAIAGAVIVAVLVVSRPAAVLTEAVRPRLAPLAAGLATAVGLIVVAAGPALLTQFRGPLTETGTPWPMAKYGSQPADLVTAPDSVLLHSPGFPAYLRAAHQFRAEYFSYLGWPLLIVVLAGSIWGWRDLRIRVAAVCWAVLELLSLGDHPVHLGGWNIPVWLLPWHVLGRLPVLSETTPDRFSILADGAAAVVLALTIDRAWAALGSRRARTESASGRAAWTRPGWRIAVPVATWLILLPVIPRPVVTNSVFAPPAGWNTTVNSLRLPAGAGVLVTPTSPVMEWQALTGQDISLVGGYCIVANLAGRASTCSTRTTMTASEYETLTRLNGLATGRLSGPSRRVLAAALTRWRLSAVISTDGSHSQLARYLGDCLGRPSVSSGGVLGWHVTAATIRRLCPPPRPRQP